MRRHSLSRLPIAALTCLVLGVGEAAAAPPAPGEAAPRLVAPELLSEPSVPYPAEALVTGETPEDAAVIVTLVVTAEGSVGEVRAVDGPEPFARLAREAATGLRFAPARRGELAVAATVRVQLSFRAPRPAPLAAVPDEPSTQPAPATAPPPPADDPEEVTVRGLRALPPQAQSLRAAEVRLLPGAFGDPFRAIDALPGVVPTISGFPYFYIRGAPPSNVAYTVDDIRVPYLFHFLLGPSVIQPAAVERVDLMPSAFPARYGRAAGSVVAAQLANPRDRFGIDANVRLYDAGGMAQTPFAGGRGHVQLGGRYSYTAGLFSVFAPDTTVDYRDYHGRIDYQLTPRDRLTLLTFGASDYVTDMQEVSSFTEDGGYVPTSEKKKVVLFAAEFHRLDLRWEHRVSARTQVRNDVIFGLDRSRIDGERFARDWLVSTRSEVRHDLGDGAVLGVGNDTLLNLLGGDMPNYWSTGRREYEAASRLYGARNDLKAGVWAELSLPLGPRLTLTPGLRADLWSADGDTAFSVDPRLSGLLRISQRVRLPFAHGIAHQTPAFPIPVPAITVRGLGSGLQSVTQSAAGVEWDAPLAVTLASSLFLHSYRRVRDFSATQGDVSPFEEDPDASQGRGHAFGLELSARRSLTQRLGAIVAYTLSRNVRLLALDGPRGGSRGYQVSPFDRTHVVSAALSYDLGRGWRLGGRYLQYTGWPSLGVAGALAGERLPTFRRADVRLEKRWAWGDQRSVSLIFEGLNVTLAKETIGYDCNDFEGCRPQVIGPISVPNIGVEAKL